MSMSDLQFDEGTNFKKRVNKQTTTAMTRFIKKVSFGLIKSDKQVDILKLIIVVLGLAWSIFYFTAVNDIPIEQPTYDLINGDQSPGQ